MKDTARKPVHPTLIRLVIALVALGSIPLAHADRDRGDHERFEHRDRRDDRPYRSDHWVFDSRFRHNHYYPAPGYSVSVLPPGYLDLSLRSGHLFFRAGVWFRPEGNRYVVVAPPPGVAIPVLPPAYTSIWIGGSPYYYANGVYYSEIPSGGYVVAAPPPEYQEVTVPPPPPPPMVAAPVPFTPPFEDGLIVYPKNGQSEARMATDRSECTRWAVNQTGYDPAKSSPSDGRRSDFQRAASACLEAHGYTVR
jgi:hypothetical protein